MVLFRKTLKTSIVIIFSFITFLIILTSCESDDETYCDYDVGICLNLHDYDFPLDLANYECKADGSFMLEIYDDNYKEVTIKALQKFGLEDRQLLFGLLYTEEEFHWLSKREVTVELDGMDKFYSVRHCYSFLTLSKSQLRVEPTCDGVMPYRNFVCLKEFNQSTTLLTTTNIVIPNMSPSNLINNQLPDDNYDQLNELQKKIIGIGVGVVLFLILVVVVGSVLGLYLYRRRKNGEITNVTEESMNQNYQYAITDYLELTEDEQVNTDYLEVIEDEQVNTDYLEAIEDEQVNTDYLEVIGDEQVKTNYLEVIEDEQVNTDYLEVIKDENVYTDLAQHNHPYESLKVHK